MSGIIHFSSGKTLEITEIEFQNMSPKLNMKGIKTQKTKSGHLIPLNSMTMEFIEHKPEEVEMIHRPVAEKPVLPIEQPELPPMDKQEAKPAPKTNEELLDEMMAKSNCKHEPEKLELYVQQTAKGARYFPVCSFCGKRERYVSERKIAENAYAGTPNEKWTSDDIANAKEWIEA